MSTGTRTTSALLALAAAASSLGIRACSHSLPPRVAELHERARKIDAPVDDVDVQRLISDCEAVAASEPDPEDQFNALFAGLSACQESGAAFKAAAPARARLMRSLMPLLPADEDRRFLTLIAFSWPVGRDADALAAEGPEFWAYVDAIAAASPDRATQAACRMSKIQYWDDRVHGPSPPDDARRDQVLAVIRDAEKHFHDCKGVFAAGGIEQLAQCRNALTRNRVGMPASEIDGSDLDGVRFKLSDYRGKVVVLDFWGFW